MADAAGFTGEVRMLIDGELVEAASGKRETGISLQTDDIDGFHAQLRQAGVDVDAEVSRMGDPVPPMFWLRDPEGNLFCLVPGE